MLPLGSEGVEIAKVGAAAWMAMLSAVVTEFGGVAESVTFNVMGEAPAAVGVPVITPVLGFKARPAGSVPVAKLQVTGVVPPVDCKVAL